MPVASLNRFPGGLLEKGLGNGLFAAVLGEGSG